MTLITSIKAKALYPKYHLHYLQYPSGLNKIGEKTFQRPLVLRNASSYWTCVLQVLFASEKNAPPPCDLPILSAPGGYC